MANKELSAEEAPIGAPIRIFSVIYIVFINRVCLLIKCMKRGSYCNRDFVFLANRVIPDEYAPFGAPPSEFNLSSVKSA